MSGGVIRIIVLYYTVIGRLISLDIPGRISEVAILEIRLCENENKMVRQVSKQ